MLEKSIFCEIKQVLESAYVCQRCILRFLGDKDYTHYNGEESVKKALHQLLGLEEGTDGSPPPKRPHPSPCAVCLGLLQDTWSPMLQKIQEALLKSGHIFEDFLLQVSVPVVIDLRERLFLLHLKEKKFRDSFTWEVPSAKEAWKWAIGSQLGRLTGADFSPESPFRICVSADYPHTSQECFPLLEKSPESFPNRKKRKVKIEDIYSRTAVMKAIETLSSELCELFPVSPPVCPSVPLCWGAVHCLMNPLYLGGRYTKHSRTLSQTPWMVDGGVRRMESSVQELITDAVIPKIVCDKIVFSASGREDVDVKMLGDGRPFVLEILNPRNIKWAVEEIKSIEKEINGSTDAIAIRDFQVISKQDTLLLKEGEEHKRKTYSALCFVQKILCPEDVQKLNDLKDVILKQKTPLRVLHRRSLSTRERILHSAQAQILDPHRLRLDLETQAGTYVKEFVHGDFGRTQPSLGTLLDTRADILELDVKSIQLDWPPKPSTKVNS